MAEYLRTYALDLEKRVKSGEITVIDRFKGEFAWLSNFYYYDTDVTVEHIFQASKVYRDAMYSEDMSWQAMILQAETPGKAKELGRQAPLRKDWDKVRVRVMYEALLEKFDRPWLQEYLLATGNIPLIEGNTWHDNFWGDCKCKKCDTLGHNHLGILLMRVRNELRAASEKLTEESS